MDIDLDELRRILDSTKHYTRSIFPEDTVWSWKNEEGPYGDSRWTLCWSTNTEEGIVPIGVSQDESFSNLTLIEKAPILREAVISLLSDNDLLRFDNNLLKEEVRVLEENIDWN